MILSGLAIGSLTLTPSFDPEVTEYTAETDNESDAITIECDDSILYEIIVNGNEIENGASATWIVGDNEVVINLYDADDDGNDEPNITYTVAVVCTRRIEV